MVDKIEQSPNDRAKCWLCDKSIKKEDKRFMENSSFRGYLTKRYLCFNCGLARLKKEITEIEKHAIEKRKILYSARGIK